MGEQAASDTGDLTGRVAIVTGATRGIGQAIAAALVREGMLVAVSGRNLAAAEEAAGVLTRPGPGRAIGAACDVRDNGSVRALVDRTTSEFGRLDVLVNNAGIGLFGAVPDMDPADFRRVVETNLIGVFHCCHAAIPAMRAAGGGFIVNIGSLAGRNAFAGGAAYNASKFGLIGFGEAMMQDVRYDGIRVSTVMPGSVATGFAGHETGAGADWKLSPDDVADVVVNLLRSHPRSLASLVELRPSQPRKG